MVTHTVANVTCLWHHGNTFTMYYPNWTWNPHDNLVLGICYNNYMPLYFCVYPTYCIFWLDIFQHNISNTVSRPPEVQNFADPRFLTPTRRPYHKTWRIHRQCQHCAITLQPGHIARSSTRHYGSVDDLGQASRASRSCWKTMFSIKS